MELKMFKKKLRDIYYRYDDGMSTNYGQKKPQQQTTGVRDGVRADVLRPTTSIDADQKMSK
jgi:hypothetical protein